MAPNVFILATVRNPELRDAALLVFDSIRVGFPTANIKVFLNRLDPESKMAVMSKCLHVGARVIEVDTTHWDWIENLVEWEQEPFVLCDTDVIFWEKVEDWQFDSSLAGLYMPEFHDEFTKAVTKPRLHTSLLFVKPVELREQIEKYYATIPDSWFTPKPNLFATQFVPRIEHDFAVNDFYDTCSMLYHAVGGEQFSAEQVGAYSHLHCACSSDIVGPHVTDGGMQHRHRMIFKNPELARGIQEKQAAYFYGRSTSSGLAQAVSEGTAWL